MNEFLMFYRSLGCQIIPLWGVINGACRCKAGADCQNVGKHPKGKWRGEPSGTPSSVDNVGVSTDRLVVLDFDTVAAFDAMAPELTDTFVVRTSRGVHVWYRASDAKAVRSIVGWRPSVDIRAMGGLVVAPPSRTVQPGVRYEAITGLCAVAMVPDALLEVLPEHVPFERRTYHGLSPLRSSTMTSRHFRPLVDSLLGQLSMAVSGTRNLTLFKVSSRLRELVDGGYAAETVRDELVQAALAIGLDREEIDRTIESGWRRA